jgi:hypothetical protein
MMAVGTRPRHETPCEKGGWMGDGSGNAAMFVRGGALTTVGDLHADALGCQAVSQHRLQPPCVRVLLLQGCKGYRCNTTQARAGLRFVLCIDTHSRSSRSYLDAMQTGDFGSGQGSASGCVDSALRHLRATAIHNAPRWSQSSPLQNDAHAKRQHCY